MPILISTVVASCSSFGSSTSVTDGGAPPDASADASADAQPADVDPYRTGFCDRQPTSLFFCDDFDLHALGGNWSENATFNGGALDLTQSARSAPSAMLATSSAAGQAWAYLRKDLGPTNRVIVSFDMKIEARGTSYAEAVGLVLNDPKNPDPRYAIVLTIGEDGSLSVNEAYGPRISAPSFTPSPSVTAAWARFEMDFDLAGRRIRVRVNDASTFAVDASLTPPTAIPGFARSLSFGLSHFTIEGWRVAFDNVTCDLK